MELTAQGSSITVTRTTKAKSAPMREFSAVYTGSSVPVEGLTAANSGEELTGVSRDVFRRSAFLGQGTVAVSGSPELEKRISAIVSTGEEQTSFSEADGRLRQWLRLRRYNRRGLLPELEAKMDDAERRLSEMDGSVQSLETMERQLAVAREECAELEKSVNESRRRQRRDALERLNSSRAELSAQSQRHDEALSQLSQRRAELRDSRFGDRESGELEVEVQRDIDELTALKSGVKKKPSPLPAIICFILAGAAAALYTHFDQLVYMICAAAAGLATMALLFRYTRRVRAVSELRERRRLILKKYQVSHSADIRDALDRHRELTEAVRLAEQEESESRAGYEAAREAQGRYEEAALQELDFSGGSTEAARLSRELAAARSRAERLREQIAGLSGRLAVMGDPLVVSSGLGCMREEYELISGEYDALTLAVDTLRAADAELQSRFSPELGRVAASYMAQVTGGRYADVLINRDFTAKTRTRDDVVARDAEYLSAGTLDLMYLAVRLAVCELALPEGEACPLIIDDALVNLDETRFKQAMELLKTISKQRQVILFTCRK